MRRACGQEEVYRVLIDELPCPAPGSAWPRWCSPAPPSRASAEDPTTVLASVEKK